MRTFSVCNDDPRINEQPYIDVVNRECQAEPVKFFLSDDDAEKNLDQFIYHQDEPTFSLSQYGEFCVMRLAREHGVPVLLNGQGGDEALCGYRKFAFFYLKQLLSEHRYAAATSHLLGLLAFGDRQLLQFWQGTRYAPAWLRRRYDVMTDVLKPDWYPTFSVGLAISDEGYCGSSRTSMGLTCVNGVCQFYCGIRIETAWRIASRLGCLWLIMSSSNLH